MFDEFKTYKVNTAGMNAMEDVSSQFEYLLGKILLHVPPGRYASIVRTKLEEACFFAKKGISSAEHYQQ